MPFGKSVVTQMFPINAMRFRLSAAVIKRIFNVLPRSRRRDVHGVSDTIGHRRIFVPNLERNRWSCIRRGPSGKYRLSLLCSGSTLILGRFRATKSDTRGTLDINKTHVFQVLSFDTQAVEIRRNLCSSASTSSYFQFGKNVGILSRVSYKRLKDTFCFAA